MAETRELICIGCPMGCMLNVTIQQGQVEEITGNTCGQGVIYAKKEVTNPSRIVTSSVRISGGQLPVVSVKTREDIPKDKISECIKALKQAEAKAPVQIGDVIVKNIADTGTDIVATRQVLAVSDKNREA